MQKNNIIFFILAIISVFFVTLIVNINKLESEIKKCKHSNDKSELENTLLFNTMTLCYEIEGRTIPDMVLKNKENKEAKLSELLNTHEYKLVLFFSFFNCESCVTHAMHQIDKISKDLDNDKVIIIAQFENKRQFMSYLNAKKINNLSVFYYDKTDSTFDIEQPFICLINKNMKTENFFIPIKEIPELSSAYLNAIKVKLTQ